MPNRPGGAEGARGDEARRWLLLVHLLPSSPSNLRVRTWRRLQELGAVAVKQSVYVLPDLGEAREDFEWLKVEIEGAGGEAVLYSAVHLDPSAEAALIDQFRDLRKSAYTELAAELRAIQRAASTPSRRRDLARSRERFAAIERIDFFGADGRDQVVTMLTALEGDAQSMKKHANIRASSNASASAKYRNRHWVTRPRPGVDRMASAWLIRRFIDAKARFGFITDVKAAGTAVPFDMFGGGFGHENDRCTFETLAAYFAVDDPAVRRIGEIVHDLDLKDDKYGAPETATIGAAIDGLQLSHADDGVLLEQGMTLFEALYRSFAQKAPVKPTRTAAARKRKTARRK